MKSIDNPTTRTVAGERMPNLLRTPRVEQQELDSPGWCRSSRQRGDDSGTGRLHVGCYRMGRTLVLLTGLLVFTFDTLAALDRGVETVAVQRKAAPRQTTSRITVVVPDASAELEVDGKPIAGTGTSRDFD